MTVENENATPAKKTGFTLEAVVAQIFIWSVVLIPTALLVSCIVSLAMPPSEETLRQRKAADMIYAAKQTVKSYLKDPDSAEFDGVFYSGKAVCGLVNARNSFGGYGGFQRFVVTGPLASIEGTTSKFEKLWNLACREK